ncbi:hypothetical protein EJ04DRAFT_517758, partial [Polyplosphaeria fusca]
MANSSYQSFETELRHFFTVLLIGGVPFAVASIFQSFALPRGYKGIRNEQLLAKDQATFDMWNYSAYNLVKSDDVC